MAEATYTFASRVQRGFEAQASGSAHLRATVEGEVPVERDVAMMGPGDVVGIGAGQVIRTWPKPGVHNAEPNYLALVELDAPELPWLVSRPAPDGQVHPWLMLVVVDATDGDPLSVGDDGRVTVTVPADQRPDPTEAWLWTHAQLLGSDTVPDDPTRSLARLVCPRRLQPLKEYVACVVPTFDAGAQAGRGETPDPAALAGTTPGWTPTSGPVELPVYFHWRFGTGPHGDFETLVRRLHGVPLPPGMGRRRLRLDHPLSGGLPPSGVGDLELHVALRPPGEQTDALPVQASYVDALRRRLADADYDVSLLAGQTPVVGPPVHGQLPVGTRARASALGDGTLPPWLDELNLDPRHRVAAGLGAEVVRRNQEHYLEEAWRQVGDVLAANRLRRRAEYSLGATRRLYDRWIARLDDADLVTVTAPVHAKVAVARDETVVGRLRDSPVPPAAASVELRRFARARGALSQGVKWQPAAGVQALASVADRPDALLQPVALDSVVALEPPSSVWGTELSREVLGRLVTEAVDVTPEVAAERLDAVAALPSYSFPTADEVRAQVAAVQPDLDRTLSGIGLVPLSVVTDVVTDVVTPPEPVHPPVPPPVPPIRPPRPPFRPPVGPVGPFGRGRVLGRGIGDRFIDVDVLREEPGFVDRVDDRIVIDTVRVEESTRIGADAIRIRPDVLDQVIDGTFEPPPLHVAAFDVPAAEVDGVRAEIGEVAVGLAGLVLRADDAASRPGRVLAGGLGSLRDALVTALDPRDTILRAVNSRIRALREPEAEVLDDIMAAPDLSEPTYQQLAAISHDWLLPGLDQLPTDTTTLVEANLEFIASFLVGMNHELARELLWREYPTDQRGTYARQFWTHVARAEADASYDLKHPLHGARHRSLRGLTTKAAVPPEGDPLVLVVKGDLVQRYPGLILVAATTESRGGLRVPSGTPMAPDFLGLLAPDVLLAGFTDLTSEIVWEAEEGPAEGRWWFFFAEHFSEPRFGLDDTSAEGTPTQWNSAAWSHLDEDELFLSAQSFAGRSLKKGDGKGDLFPWGTDAGLQAWVTLQFPFRRGIPAIDLLPPREDA